MRRLMSLEVKVVRAFRPCVAVLALLATGGCTRAMAASDAAAVPAPLTDVAAGIPGQMQSAVFAGGCFWGIQAVFQHVKGVQSAVSGYAGGDAHDARYEAVGSGNTGHAESVEVTYDPTQVSYGRLLEVFFSVAHDPTQLNRQGPDYGSQYRSALFTTIADQQRVAQAYIAQLNSAKVFRAPVVTVVSPLRAFYRAEQYHQDYARLHPENRYIVINDAPKVAQLQLRFADLYSATPAVTGG